MVFRVCNRALRLPWRADDGRRSCRSFFVFFSVPMEYILGGGSLETHYLSAQDVRNSARGHMKPAVTATKLQMQNLSIYGSVRVGFGSFDPARSGGV